MGPKTSYASQDKPRRYRRAEVDQALASLKDEDLNILRWLLRYPFSRAEDLAQARSVRLSTVYRHLEFQQNLGVVESITPPILGTVRCALYHLSNLGIHVVATHMHRSATALARHCHSDEQSLQAYLPRLAHLTLLQDLINGIDARAPKTLGLLGYRARVWWACVRDYRHTFVYRERTYAIEASGGLVLQVRPSRGSGSDAPDRWYSLFILLDEGLESIDLITARLRALIYYRESPERWRGEQSYYHYFPTILVLTTTAHRQEHWLRKAREVAERAGARPLEGAITTREAMKEAANRAQFPWHMPWKSLSGLNEDYTGHLHELFEPMPPEAIPPGLLLPHEWQDLDFEDLPPATTPRQMGRPLPTVIEGNFARRAQQFRAEPPVRFDSREQVALLSLNLSYRLFDLLAFILDHPMISIQELAALQGLQPVSIERYIRELRSLGCLELVDTRRYQQEMRKRAPEGLRETLVVKDDIGQRWHLSERGMLVLAAAYRFSIHAITLEEGTEQEMEEKEEQELMEVDVDASTWSDKSLIQRAVAGIFRLRRIEHNTGVYRFFAELRQGADLERAHKLLWWETGIFIGRRYPDHDRMHNLRPDAAWAYQVGNGRPLRFWLEWDRDTMNVKGLKKKFQSYQYYILSRRDPEERQLPWLLIVVPEYNQELLITRLAIQELSKIEALTLRITTASLIEQRGPLGEIWLPVLPVRAPSQGQPQTTQRCRFFETLLSGVR